MTIANTISAEAYTMTAPKAQDTTPPVTKPATAVREAPMIPSQSPFVVRARELEAKIEADAARHSREKSLHRHALEAQLADLKRLEGMREAGASTLTPMAEVMRRPMVEAAEKNPDLHLRWVDEGKEGRVAHLQHHGYRKLSESEGGKQLGKSALYGIPRERHGELEAAKRMRTASRLRSYRTEIEETTERVLEEINKQTGHDFKTRDHLINEE